MRNRAVNLARLLADLLTNWRHQHTWSVAWNDDDVCRCGAWRYWPSGDVVEPAQMSPQLRYVARAAAGSLAH